MRKHKYYNSSGRKRIYARDRLVTTQQRLRKSSMAKSFRLDIWRLSLALLFFVDVVIIMLRDELKCQRIIYTSHFYYVYGQKYSAVKKLDASYKFFTPLDLKSFHS